MVNTKPLKGSVVSLKDLFQKYVEKKNKTEAKNRTVTNKQPKALNKQLNTTHRIAPEHSFINYSILCGVHGEHHLGRLG